MRKTIASVLLAGTLAAGGAVAIGSTVSAGASTPAPTTQSSNAAKPAAVKHPALRRALRRAVVRISAQTIGVTPQDLIQELKAGKSIADVANEHSVAPQTVVTALVTAGDNAVERAVANHRITAQRANRIEARLPGLVTKIVNHHFK